MAIARAQVLLAALCFATTGTAQALGPHGTSPVGVGAARRLSAVRWNVASNIIVAWTVTLPAAAAIGAGTYWLTGLFT